MYALFDLFMDICLLRKGPQNLPASQPLLKLALLAYAGSSLLGFLLIAQPLSALLQTLADVGLLIGLTYGVLLSARYRTRFVQTLTALAGAGALLSLISLPLLLWITRDAVGGQIDVLPRLLYLCLLAWYIGVLTHILHHALSVNRWLGLLYALGYFIVSSLLMDFLFPVPQI